MILQFIKIFVLLFHLSRVCGDDPCWRYKARSDPIICPAYAGMILVEYMTEQEITDLSRVCGDDPVSGQM